MTETINIATERPTLGGGGRPALFLDRDGVINIDHGYVYRPDQFDFVPGIFELCRYARSLDYLIVVVTNQAGIGRGYYSEAEFRELTEWMRAVFRSEGINVERVYYCPDHPEHGQGKYKRDSWRRKPNPGMIEEAIRDFGIDPARSVLIGDKDSDIEAARHAGIGLKLLFGSSTIDAAECCAVHSLVDAMPVLARFSASVAPKASIFHDVS